MNFAALEQLRVLLIGDAIVDRYVFVRSVGKSIKEPVISVSHEREESWRGGVWAAAAHLAELVGHVEVMHGASETINTRFVESTYNRKLFTLHERRAIAPSAPARLADYDVVIVADFGHGALTPELVRRVQEEARYLVVNAQTNSQNFGFHLVTKYRRADLVVVDQLEARLAAQDNASPIEAVLPALGYPKVAVTLGAAGAIGWDGETLHRVAARADRVVDTMGAGDAFLVVAAVVAATGAPMAEVVAAGNAAGAAKVGIVGHRRAIRREDLQWS